ncbi:MAG: amidohydrolase [Pontibacterium sp.]
MKNSESCNVLKVLALQVDIAWEDKAANLAAYSAKLSSAQNIDLIVLPEMFATGFSMAVEQMAEPATGGDVLAWMQALAQDKQSAVCGSVMVSAAHEVNAKHKAFNRHYFVYPDGCYHFYDKRHLFRMGEENNHFLAGDKRVIVHYRGWRILLQTCYDLRFPVFGRNQSDYDLMINVASWPAARRDVWRTLLKARALENQCFVLGVNRMGEDGMGLSYTGDSLLYTARGEALFDGQPQQTPHVACLLSASLDLAQLRKFQSTFPVALDADPFVLNNAKTVHLE